MITSKKDGRGRKCSYTPESMEKFLLSFVGLSTMDDNRLTADGSYILSAMATGSV